MGDPQSHLGQRRRGRHLALVRNQPGNKSHPAEQVETPEEVGSRFACMFACQILARTCAQRAPNQRVLPSGVRIFYYTLLALHRQGLLEGGELSPRVLTLEMTDAFLTTAQKVATGLRRHYAAAIHLRRAPLAEAARILGATETLVSAARLEKGERELPLPQEIPGARSASQSALSEPQLAAAVAQFFAFRLPVSPVASPEDALPVAFRLLRKQVLQATVWIRQAPLGELYCYEEPLSSWLQRLVQTHPWLQEILQLTEEST